MPNLHSPRLILSPTDSYFQVDQLESLVRLLTTANFISEKTAEQNQHLCFELGDNFLQQITFLGCSPTLQSDDPSQTDVFISLVQYQQPKLNYSSTVPPPRCPSCHKTHADWQQAADDWQPDQPLPLECPHCQENIHFTDMIWKKNGGVAQLLLQIHGIQESLAVPNESLLALLKAHTDTDWIYYFAEK